MRDPADPPVALQTPAGPEPAVAAPAPHRPEDRRRLWRRHPVLVLGGISLALIAGLSLWLVWGLPLSKAMEPLASPTLVLVADDGKAFARRGAYKEEPVISSKLPRHVNMAFVAIEDRRFYRHGGLDARAIGRAFVRNMEAGEVEQGGSTITQQLAKNAFLTNERSYRRKAREALIALYLETALTKDEILSRYLSSVYFGDGVFGLRAAARHYFDKTPEALTVGEAAMLAGIIKAPSRLAPTEDLAAARGRMNIVLAEMVDIGELKPEQAKAAAKAVRLRDGRPELPVGSYFADWVSAKAKRRFDRAYGELPVLTTLDADLQARAERAMARVMAGGDKVHATQVALVAMRTDGRVVAMVGGRDYRKSQFNRAVQAQRQPGSAFKPVVYLAAFRQGSNPDSLVMDAPFRIGDWAPQNHEAKYAGNFITYRQAFARSSNVAAARIGQETGRAAIEQAARDLGIRSPMPQDVTIALGSGSVSLLELTSAYAAIATGASPVTARGLADERPEPISARLSDRERRGLLDLLHAVISGGTGAGANPGVPAYGKTGTSQDYRDAWFIGFAGDLVVGVWVGNDDNTPMRRVVGGSLPAQIWREVMSYAATRAEFQGGPVGPFAPALQLAEAKVEPGLNLEGVILEEPPVIEDESLPPFMRDPPRPFREPPSMGPRPGQPPFMRDPQRPFRDGPPPFPPRRGDRFSEDAGPPFPSERPTIDEEDLGRALRRAPQREPDRPGFEEVIPDAVG